MLSPHPQVTKSMLSILRLSIRAGSSIALLLCALASAQNPLNIDLNSKGSRWPAFGTDSGAANAYVVTTVAPLAPSLRTGSQIMFKAVNGNTGASTLAV